MAKNVLLLSLVNSALGEGVKTSRENYAYHCPKCSHKKKKLEVDFTDNPQGNNPWQCWVCNFKGRTVMALLKAVGAPEADIRKARSYVKYVDFEDEAVQEKTAELPEEFISFTDPLIKKDWIYERAIKYIASRGITMGDIYKYQIGYCRSKKYRNMIIFPTFDEKGLLNYFVARTFDEDNPYKYKNPPVGKNIVPNEHLINWDVPVILCEGIFDAIAIKRNAIPLLGKTIQKQLMRKLLNSNAGKIYLALDKDAQNKALDYCEMFLDQGKEVYFVDLEKKDPSELGFESFTKLVQQTKPLNYDSLLLRKLDI